jgi:site-specific recombinase XerD
MNLSRAASLRPGQFKHLIRVASVTGRMQERDVMLLWLTHTTGISVTELALLKIGDVLYPSGAINPEGYLRAYITKGCWPRNVHLTHARCLAALDAWFEVRSRRSVRQRPALIGSRKNQPAQPQALSYNQ